MARNENSTPQDLLDAIREHLTPHAVALIAAKLQVSYCGGKRNDEMVAAEEQCQWFEGEERAPLLELFVVDLIKKPVHVRAPECVGDAQGIHPLRVHPQPG